MLGLNPYLLGGVAAVIVALGSFGGCQYVRAEAADAKAQKEGTKREAAEAGRDKALDANSSQQITIVAQSKALDQWAALGTTPEEVAEFVRSLDVLSKRLLAEATEYQKVKEHDRANPDCAALLSTSIQRACPGIAGVLRYYESRYEDGDGRSAGAGGEAAAGEVNGGLPAAVPVPAR